MKKAVNSAGNFVSSTKVGNFPSAQDMSQGRRNLMDASWQLWRIKLAIKRPHLFLTLCLYANLYTHDLIPQLHSKI